jgi:hypothetical protein
VLSTGLEVDQIAGGSFGHTAAMANLIYRCPQTGMNVQAWMPEDEQTEGEQVYKALLCSACTRLHFIHKLTGKLLGEPEGE